MKGFFPTRLSPFSTLHAENIFLRATNLINDTSVSWSKEVIPDNSNRKRLLIPKETEGRYFPYFMYDISVFLHDPTKR